MVRQQIEQPGLNVQPAKHVEQVLNWPVIGASKSKLLRPRLEHRNSTGISQERNFGGKSSFEPFGTQE
jgi:hypothetical protein